MHRPHIHLCQAEPVDALLLEDRIDPVLKLRRAGASRLLLRTDGDWLRDIIRHVASQRRLGEGAR